MRLTKKQLAVMKIVVRNGRQIVNNIWLAKCSDDSYILMADMGTKRAGIFGVMTGNSENTIILESTPETLNNAATTEDTVITIIGLDEMCCHAHISRYTLYAFFWKPEVCLPENGHVVAEWSKP